jgi:hypothetical protein
MGQNDQQQAGNILPISLNAGDLSEPQNRTHRQPFVSNLLPHLKLVVGDESGSRQS